MKTFNLPTRPQLRNESGFTFVEIVVVFGILSVLFAIGYISVSSIQTKSITNASISVIKSDIKSQQIKAMAGETEGSGGSSSFGVKILTDSYVLFKGTVYNPSDTSNYVMEAPPNHAYSTTFPDTTIIFTRGTGEVGGYVDGQDTVTLTNQVSGRTQTLEFNKYGTIVSTN